MLLCNKCLYRNYIFISEKDTSETTDLEKGSDTLQLHLFEQVSSLEKSQCIMHKLLLFVAIGKGEAQEGG